MVARVANIPAEDLERVGRRNMLRGAFWCSAGVMATIVSYYLAATSPGGGKYLITWGAVLFGVVLFLRGMVQWLGRR